MTDPTAVVANEPMHFRQARAVAIIVICVAIDGFDVFAIAFASPVIAEQWSIDTAALGVVLSMKLVGMGVGAYALGTLADVLGRRTIVIACLGVTASGMWLGSVAAGVTVLAMARLYTGIGIGGLLAAGSAIVYESANDRRRDMAAALMVAGYPLGAAAGGVVAAAILAGSDRWQTIFEVGAIATATLIVPVALFVPETIAFLHERRPRQALQRINRVLLQYGQAPLADISAAGRAPSGARLLRLFERDTAAVTLALTAAFFMHMMTFYFLMKWIPKLVVDLGHSVAAASMVLVFANAMGAAGSLTMSLLTLRYPVRGPGIAAMVCGCLAVLAFGQGVQSLVSFDRGGNRRILHDGRHGRFLRAHGALVSRAPARERSRLRHRRGPSRRRGGADRRGAVVRGRVAARRSGRGFGLRLPAGRRNDLANDCPLDVLCGRPSSTGNRASRRHELVDAVE